MLVSLYDTWNGYRDNVVGFFFTGNWIILFFPDYKEVLDIALRGLMVKSAKDIASSWSWWVRISKCSDSSLSLTICREKKCDYYCCWHCNGDPPPPNSPHPSLTWLYNLIEYQNTFSRRFAMVIGFEQHVRVRPAAVLLLLLTDWWREPVMEVDRVPES